MADAEAVRARAEARRAKLLAKSEDRLKAIEKREVKPAADGGMLVDAVCEPASSAAVPSPSFEPAAGKVREPAANEVSNTQSTRVLYLQTALHFCDGSWTSRRICCSLRQKRRRWRRRNSALRRAQQPPRHVCIVVLRGQIVEIELRSRVALPCRESSKRT